MEAEPSVPVSPTTLKAAAIPFTPKGKGINKRVLYADAVNKQDSNSDTSRPSSPTPNLAKKKNKTAPVSKPSPTSTSHKALKKQPVTPASKTISTVMTGYNPKFKENIREITVYDIPSRWTQLDVLNHLKNWGQVIAIKFKSQQKYTTVTVSVDLNKAALDLWNGGAWTASLGGIPVRWFPANWDLKQRKERERFQAVLIGSSQQTNYASSYAENASSDMKIFAYLEHQSPLQQIVAQIESEVDQQMEVEPSVPVSPTTLKADAEPFTPKGKGGRKKRVSYADVVKQDSNSDTSRPSSPSPTVEKKKKKTASVSKPSLSNNSRKALKKQHATPTGPRLLLRYVTGRNFTFI
ncbi:hypothetical protein RhiirA4_480020 [Rhizophagus irregularis]|uniref:Uncharacterized protein n=1 Tax=Rhizophagus irregularis TaxID=588596 RepID=A0A2I1HHB6_9GLOM|nr:hypothetical protein RhiirA4_480020 [Rhizophagus irregularis]